METMDTPPDGGWGWMVVLGAALINTVNQALFSVFGLIFGDTLSDMAGGKATGLTLVMAINVMVTNFSGLAVASILKKFTIQHVTLFSVVLVASGMILSSFATQIYHIVIAYGCMTGLGLGFLASSTFLIINEYFTTRKGTAVGMAMAGTSTGQMLMPMFVSFLLDNYEFTGTTRILGCLSLTGLIGAIFFKPFLCFKSKYPNINVEAPKSKPKSLPPTEKEAPIKLEYKQETEKPKMEAIEAPKSELVSDIENNNVVKAPSQKSLNPSTSSEQSKQESHPEETEVPLQNSALSTERLSVDQHNESEYSEDDYSSGEELRFSKTKESKEQSEDEGDDEHETEDEPEAELRYNNTTQYVRPPSTNPFESDSESDGESKRVEIRNKSVSEQNLRPPSTNPFGSDSESDEDNKTGSGIRRKSVSEQYLRPPSTNPFESDVSEAESAHERLLDEEAKNLFQKIQNFTASKVSVDAPKKSSNPFGSTSDVLGIESGVVPKKFSSNPFGSIDQLAEEKKTYKKRPKLFQKQDEAYQKIGPEVQNNLAQNGVEKKKTRLDFPKPTESARPNDDSDGEDDNKNDNSKLLAEKKLDSSYMYKAKFQSSTLDFVSQKPPTFFGKLGESLGLRLLTDVKLIHLLIGLAFGYVSSVSFSTFFPLFLLHEANLSKMNSSECMTVLSLADVIGRLTVSFIAKKLKLSSRGLFMVGAIALGLCRSSMTNYG
ncbi:uncharacterized protein LOC109609533 isoform X2 [Aethina tumida]|uniref:uncharacterized protein LOC109609533 isoform X2 n=1 Tax=Aethina tumida TaxID=116153 RepID=UPI002147E973|nr:uncharacterized protein LOC109609533 isoform X2 [Aethina tumida]